MAYYYTHSVTKVSKSDAIAVAREKLRRLSRASPSGLIAIEDASAELGLSARAAALALGRLARGGWLTRVKRGLYYLLPLESGAEVVAADPWILAQAAFAPCYIGGWSAAHHWGLTEQSFRATFVATAASIRARSQVMLGGEFKLARVSRARVDSVKPIWHGSLQLRVASAERAITDACDSPSWVGGIRHLAEILLRYRETHPDGGGALLLELKRNDNGAAFRRAGFLAERVWPDAAQLIAGALAERPAGVIKLDPAVRVRGVMNRRWGLWANVDVAGGLS